MDVYRLYQSGDIEIRFIENEREKYKAIEKGEPYYLAVDIYILKEGEIISKYHRSFEKEVHFIHYQNFVKKFLRDNLYRRSFLEENENHWNGTIHLRSKLGLSENKSNLETN